MNSLIKDRIDKIEQGIVPEGYKKTELGILPEDWNVELLENLCNITTGNKNTQDKKEDGIYSFFVRSNNIEKINSYSYDGESILTAGDGVGTGKVFHYINDKFDYHQRVYCLNEFNYIQGKFLFYYFSENFIRQVFKFTAKTSVDSVRREMLTKMNIPLPNMQEQEKIADILSTWDKAIEKVENLIKQKKIQKKGLMQKLLTGETRLIGFTDEWEEVILGEIGRFATSSVNKKIDEEQQEILLLNYMDVYKNKYINGDIEFMNMTASDHQIKTNNLIIGDVLFTPSSETRDDIGHSSVIMEDIENLIYSYHLIRYRIESFDLIDLRYRGYCFNNQDILKEFSKLSTGSTRFTLSKSDFENIIIKLPPLKEQKAIALILLTADKEIELLKQLLENKKQEKKGLMQLLLTGIVRV